MKLGYNQATCMQKSTLERDLELCEKYGYEYIEIRLDMLKDYLTRYTMEDLKTFFINSTLEPFAFNSIEDINFCDEKQWKELLGLFTFACEAAREIDNPYLIVVPTMFDCRCKKTEAEVFDDTVKVLNQLADIAEPYGIKLAFEPIGDRRWCCNSLRQAYEIIQAVGREDVGLALDCINFYLNDKCADIDYLRKLPVEKLFVFHINDCEDLPFGILDHCHRLMPGEGCIPLEEITAILKDKGYDEIASIELFRPEYWEMDPEEVIRLGAEKTMKYM